MRGCAPKRLPISDNPNYELADRRRHGAGAQPTATDARQPAVPRIAACRMPAKDSGQNARSSTGAWPKPSRAARHTRKYLSEPPLDYRQAAADAPAGELGEDEYKKERRLSAQARKTAAAGSIWRAQPGSDAPVRLEPLNPPLPEEALQQLGRLRLGDARIDFRRMVAGRRGEEAHAADHRAALFVASRRNRAGGCGRRKSPPRTWCRAPASRRGRRRRAARPRVLARPRGSPASRHGRSDR